MKSLGKLVLLVVCWLFASLSAPVYSQTTYHISSAGTLKNVAGITSVTNLTLTGYIDARDVKFMRDNMPNLTTLNLSGVTIVAYSGTEGTYSSYNISYPANEMPACSFYRYTNSKMSLKSIVLPNGLTSIGDEAFYYYLSLTNITLPDGLTSIGTYAFYYCSSLTDITLPDGLTSIGSYTFSGCSSLTDITLPDKVTSIGDEAFYYCSSLTDITLPAGLTSIGNYAFYYCSSLTEINLPVGLIFIGNYAFANCSSLISVTNPNLNPIYINSNVFTEVDKNVCILTVPSNSVVAYKNTNGWKNFLNILSDGFSFRVNINNVSFGSITGTSSGLYDENTAISLTAVPADGYDFLGWTSGGSTLLSNLASTNSTYDFTLTDDIVLTAVFGKTGSYSLTKAGTLKDIPGIKTITRLILTGNIDARDIAFMRDSIPYLAETDLSGTTITAYSGADGTVDGNISYPANEMPQYSFNNGGSYSDGKTSLTSIVLPNGVTSIGNGAFYGCSRLTGITLPFGLTSIGNGAFYGCLRLTDITIPAGVTSIGSGAFYNCSSLTDITLPDGMTSIEDAVFSNCLRLTDITLPAGLTSIGNSTFQNCYSLTLTDITLPAGLTSIGNSTFQNCYSLTDIIIPAEVISIGNSTFQSCYSLIDITLPAEVTSIGSDAFYGCSSLTDITFPDRLTSIGSSAFRDCSSLTDITFPDRLTSIGYNAFYNCSGLRDITFPAELTSIGSYAFYSCSGLESVTLPAGLTSIGSSAFYGCRSLISITNPNLTPINIDSNVFYGVNKSNCELKVSSSSVEAYKKANVWKDFVNIEDGGFSFSININNIDWGAVRGTSSGLYAAGTVINLMADSADGYDFFGWTIKGNTVSSDSAYNFSLTDDIVIMAIFGRSDSCNLTEAGTLKDIPNIRTVTHLTLTGNIDARDIAFMRDSIPYLAETDLSRATIVAYSGQDGTVSGNTSYPANEMPQYSFRSKTSLMSIVLPNEVISIGYYAFRNCSSLTNITLPDGLTSIGTYAFYSCSSLTNITLPDGLTSIGTYAFDGCSSLTDITLPAGLTSIGSYTFSYCSSLTDITLPAGLTSIGTYAFDGCRSLTNITLPAGLIGSYAFRDYAFRNCTGLTSITNLNPTPAYINSYVFEGVNKSSCELIVFSSAVYSYKSASIWKEFDIKGGGLSFNVNINNGALGSITGTPSGMYDENTEINLTAAPADGYDFLGWKSGGRTLSLDSAYDFTLTSDIAITAVFGTTDIYNLTEAGTLKDIPDIRTTVHLTLTGNIDARDIAFMRDSIPSLAEVDLSEATIVAYSGSNGTVSGNTSYSANEMPRYSFYNSSTSGGNTSLTSIILPAGLTSIGERTFNGCSSLTDITLPAGLTSIGERTFLGCSSLTDITLPAGLTSIGGDAFYNCSSLTNITLPAGLTSIGDYAFYNCSSLTDITLPAGLTSIGGYAFSYCRSLTDITLPAGLTSIGQSVFSGCSSLTDVTLPAGLTSIGSYAFSSCSSLTDITLPAGLTSIGGYAFSYCSSLTDIALPDGLTSIGGEAFYSCSSLTDITLPAGLTSIGGWTFSGCSSLSSITLPVGLTSIGISAFSVCSSLTDITLPAGLTSIGGDAFYNCSSLTNITNQNSTPIGISSSVFYGVDQSNCKLTVPSSSINDYKNANVWKDFYDIIGGGYAVSVTADKGAVTGGGLYASGISVTISTTPNTGYEFVNWTSNETVISTDATYTFTVTGDIVIKANFEAIPYNIFYNLGGGTNHYINPAAYTVESLTIILQNPTRAGYDFTGWTEGNTIPVGSTGDKTFTAQWSSPIVYNITYELDGGTNGANPATYTVEDAVTLQTPTRTGYDFTGWSEGNTILVGSTGNKTFTAQWSATVYNITYELSGGTNGANPATYTVENAITLQTPTRTGYDFTGWTEGNGTIPIGSTGNKTFTAQWTVTVYSITYELNGGTNSGANPPTYTVEDAVTLQTPTRAGYEFTYWTEGNSTIPVGSTGDKTFTAQWTATVYSISYELNGGTNGANPATYTVEDAVTLQTPARAGYDFTGWSEGNTISVGSTGDKTFTAQWSTTVYSITYELNGGTNSGGNPAAYTVESPTITLQDPTRANHAFTGWTEGNTIPAGSTGDRTFTAQWISGYTITYILGEGGVNHSGNPATYTVTDGVTLQNPTRAGYNFTGWSPDNKINAGSTGDKTFTAQWSTIAYGITYALNGGTNHSGNPATYTVESAAISLQTPTRAGYTFTGWAEGSTIAAGSTGDKIFTAQWLVTIYNVAYQLGGGVNHSGNPATYTVTDGVTLQNPTRAGYNFTGWSPDNKITVGSTSDKTFTAQWSAIAYGITYTLNGGTNHSGNPATYTIENAVTLQTPTRAGYTFTGWAEGSTIAAGSTGDKIFTAQWSIITYNIIYQLGGGTNHSDNSATYTVNEGGVLQNPTRAGYNFTGWSPDGKIDVGSTGDKTFTAQWSAIAYGITYALNGGTNHSGNPATYTVESAAISLQTPTRAGYTFTGWTEGSTIAAGSMGDKTFTAQWSVITYNVAYQLGGGVNHSGNPATYTVTDGVTLQNPTRTGYNFTGWSPDGKIDAGSTGDKTFTAQWSAIAYGITYALDGGTNHAGNPATYTVESAAISLQTPTRAGYTFTGWAEGSTIAAGSMGDKTFTAQWKCNEANIEEIAIDEIELSENGGVFEYTVRECGESSISPDLNVSPHATVTVNGEAYAPGMEIALNGDLTTVNIRVESETGDNNKSYTLKIAAPLNVSALYYQRWNDVIAVNRNPATNGGYSVSDVRWYKRDGTPAGEGDFISIRGTESVNDYYSEVKTTETNVWQRVCATAETRSLDKIVAYPNPVPQGEKVTVKLPESYVNGVLNIYDIRGGLVKSGLPLPATVNSVDVSELAPGIYLLRITDKQGKSETVKIVKN